MSHLHNIRPLKNSVVPRSSVISLCKRITNKVKPTKKFNLTISRLAAHQLDHLDTSIPHKNALSIDPNKKVVDLRYKFPEPFDQGSLGSCTANALCGVIAYDIPNFMGSRLFLYYNERKIENDIPDDAGAILSDGVQSLITYGICPEAEWVYDISKFAVKPHDSCYTTALQHRALEVKNIKNDMISMKQALDNGYPFVVGIMLFDSFQSYHTAITGIVSLPKQGETFLGGHAVSCVGYDDNQQMWIMRNSWGTGWGDKGYFYLPYSYLLGNLATDLWCVMKI